MVFFFVVFFLFIFLGISVGLCYFGLSFVTEDTFWLACLLYCLCGFFSGILMK